MSDEREPSVDESSFLSTNTDVAARLAGAQNLTPDDVTSLLGRLKELTESDAGEYDQGDQVTIAWDDLEDLLGIARILWEAHAYRSAHLAATSQHEAEKRHDENWPLSSDDRKGDG